MKYIDTEKLIAEIEALKHRKGFLPFENTEITEAYMARGVQFTCDDIVKIIQSLQQEQPEVDLVAELEHHLATTPKEQLGKEWKELEPWNNIGPTVQEFLYGKQPEVDLEKEINIEISKWTCYEEIGFGARYNAKPFDGKDIEKIARRFYNLGLNARKEEQI